MSDDEKPDPSVDYYDKYREMKHRFELFQSIHNYLTMFCFVTILKSVYPDRLEQKIVVEKLIRGWKSTMTGMKFQVKEHDDFDVLKILSDVDEKLDPEYNNAVKAVADAVRKSIQGHITNKGA